MARGKHKNISNKKPRPCGIIRTQFSFHKSLGYPHTPENQDFDKKSHFIMMIEDFNKDISNSLKEIQENTSN
jgi:hypothetical protein